jgi:phage terminase small subunit
MRKSSPRAVTHVKAVVENTDPLHYLTDQQRIFVEAIVKGQVPNLAARKAGYKWPDTDCYRCLKVPKIGAAIRFLHARYAQAAQMTRKKVMDGLLEAIELAKIQAEPATMVAGWREIGKMCGYYAPEVRKIDISITSRRVVEQLETLTDDELLKMVDDNAVQIEGQAVQVLDTLQSASDSAISAEFGYSGAAK